MALPFGSSSTAATAETGADEIHTAGGANPSDETIQSAPPLVDLDALNGVVREDMEEMHKCFRKQTYEDTDTRDLTIECNGFEWRVHALQACRSNYIGDLLFPVHRTRRWVVELQVDHINLDSIPTTNVKLNPLILDSIIHHWYFREYSVPQSIANLTNNTISQPENLSANIDTTVLHNAMEYHLRVLEQGLILQDGDLRRTAIISIAGLTISRGYVDLWYHLVRAAFGEMNTALAERRADLKNIAFEAVFRWVWEWTRKESLFYMAYSIPGFSSELVHHASEGRRVFTGRWIRG